MPAAALTVLLSAAMVAQAAGWKTHRNVRLKPDPANDGDSFHVMIDGKERILRIYFADAPETSRMIPERVAEQARHWTIRESQVLAAGREATRFTRKLLARPFTVHTRGEDARGQSNLPREFAIIETADGPLSERLVAAGHARAYGLRRTLPDGTSAKAYARHLESLEHEARRRRRGAWRGQATSLSQIRAAVENVARGRYTLRHSITLYSTNDPPRFAGTIARGTTVDLQGAASTMLVRVRFERDGKPHVGLCRRTQLLRSGAPDE